MSTNGVSPLQEFLQGVEGMQAKPSLRMRAADMPAHEAKVEAANYVANHYQNTEAVSSFTDSNGSIFDCIPFEMQPSLRDSDDTKIPVAPDLPTLDGPPVQNAVSQGLGAKQRDRYGNQKMAPSGTIPVRRLTPDEILRLGGVDSFLSKKYAPMSGSTTDTISHHYAQAKDAGGLNFGMTAKIGVWQNNVSIAKSEIFSLAQTWTLSDGAIQLQSLELVSMCFPSKFNTKSPVLCVYATNDQYKTGSGGYNLDFPGFVQTNNKWALGAALGPVSKVDGNQYYIQVACKLDGDKWWVYFGGETSASAVGYYPTSFYSKVNANGLAKGAYTCQAGGEVAFQGTTKPPMGSGVKAVDTWKKSAYIKDIRYYKSDNTTANVTFTNSSVNTASNFALVRKRYAAPWNETLWYGGPGVT